MIVGLALWGAGLFVAAAGGSVALVVVGALIAAVGVYQFMVRVDEEYIDEDGD